MYMVKIYDEEVGDLDRVSPALSMADGIQDALFEVGSNTRHAVKVDEDGQAVEVSVGEVVIARVERAEWVSACDRADIVQAAMDMQGGDTAKVTELFTGTGASGLNSSYVKAGQAELGKNEGQAAGKGESAAEVIEDAEIEHMQAWSITARLAAITDLVAKCLPEEAYRLVKEAKQLHPAVAEGAAKRS